MSLGEFIGARRVGPGRILNQSKTSSPAGPSGKYCPYCEVELWSTSLERVGH